jgi:hypothetical protein
MAAGQMVLQVVDRDSFFYQPLSTWGPSKMLLFTGLPCARPAEEKRACNWCFQQANCALAFKAEHGTGASTDAFVRCSTDRGGGLDRVQLELAQKFERATAHMSEEGGCKGGLVGLKTNRYTAWRRSWSCRSSRHDMKPYTITSSACARSPADCAFLSKWEGLVSLEEAYSTARRPEVWAMPGAERQALGRCVAGLALVVSHAVQCASPGLTCMVEGPTDVHKPVETWLQHVGNSGR